jgi:putative PIN family toxin of toxin-antitoxin system
VRVAFDTNVLVSALATRGLCADLYALVALEHELIVGKAVVEELLRVLGRKLQLPAARLTEVRALLARYEQPSAAAGVAAPVPDPADALVLAAAIAGRAELFVTGDAELLALGHFEGVSILSPRDAWLRLAQGR